MNITKHNNLNKNSFRSNVIFSPKFQTTTTNKNETKQLVIFSPKFKTLKTKLTFSNKTLKKQQQTRNKVTFSNKTLKQNNNKQE